MFENETVASLLGENTSNNPTIALKSSPFSVKQLLTWSARHDDTSLIRSATSSTMPTVGVLVSLLVSLLFNIYLAQ